MKKECQSSFVKLDEKVYPCTVSLTMSLIGGKWKAVLLYHLKDGAKRYNELRKEIPMVTEMTISLQLKQLEKDQLITRNVFGEKPPIKVIYELTDLGKSLIPLLEEITKWGNELVVNRGEFMDLK